MTKPWRKDVICRSSQQSKIEERKGTEQHRDDHLRGRQEWTGWRVSPTLLSQKGLYMSARSFVCFASCTFAMEVWGGEKVYPGTTDSEPLLGWGQNELLKPKQTIWEKVTWFLIQNKCSLLKQSFDGVYKHVIRSKKSCGLFRILKMLLMKFSVRIWLAIRKAPLQCHLVERICSDCIWVYHLDIFTLKKKNLTHYDILALKILWQAISLKLLPLLKLFKIYPRK